MYILDTHTLLWFLSDAPELSEDTKRFIANQDIAAVSIASLWEIAIKQSLNKLRLNGTIRDIEAMCYQKDFYILPINTAELDLLKTLPSIHRDPFDRLIICQTIDEDATLITRDEKIPLYPVKTMSV
ncbi:MAG: type II toxin-antitoxin system VapC family toxin [Treponema sp.]|nr:type II toxin-antitoxin system VapC family toxin [Candidatus Treponema caballi]